MLHSEFAAGEAISETFAGDHLLGDIVDAILETAFYAEQFAIKPAML